MPPPSSDMADDSGSEDERQSLLRSGTRRARQVWVGFIDFAFQGNVLEIAFGLMLVS